MSDDMISVLAKQSDELVKQDEIIARLRALNAELVEALKAARVSVADWGSYASDYFKEKWDLSGDLAFIDAAITKAEMEGA